MIETISQQNKVEENNPKISFLKRRIKAVLIGSAHGIIAGTLSFLAGAQFGAGETVEAAVNRAILNQPNTVVDAFIPALGEGNLNLAISQALSRQQEFNETLLDGFDSQAAYLTNLIRNQNQLTQEQKDQLIEFANQENPLYMSYEEIIEQAINIYQKNQNSLNVFWTPKTDRVSITEFARLSIINRSIDTEITLSKRIDSLIEISTSNTGSWEDLHAVYLLANPEIDQTNFSVEDLQAYMEQYFRLLINNYEATQEPISSAELLAIALEINQGDLSAAIWDVTFVTEMLTRNNIINARLSIDNRLSNAVIGLPSALLLEDNFTQHNLTANNLFKVFGSPTHNNWDNHYQNGKDLSVANMTGVIYHHWKILALFDSFPAAAILLGPQQDLISVHQTNSLTHGIFEFGAIRLFSQQTYLNENIPPLVEALKNLESTENQENRALSEVNNGMMTLDLSNLPLEERFKMTSEPVEITTEEGETYWVQIIGLTIGDQIRVKIGTTFDEIIEPRTKSQFFIENDDTASILEPDEVLDALATDSFDTITDLEVLFFLTLTYSPDTTQLTDEVANHIRERVTQAAIFGSNWGDYILLNYELYLSLSLGQKDLFESALLYANEIDSIIYSDNYTDYNEKELLLRHLFEKSNNWETVLRNTFFTFKTILAQDQELFWDNFEKIDFQNTNMDSLIELINIFNNEIGISDENFNTVIEHLQSSFEDEWGEYFFSLDNSFVIIQAQPDLFWPAIENGGVENFIYLASNYHAISLNEELCNEFIMYLKQQNAQNWETIVFQNLLLFRSIYPDFDSIKDLLNENNIPDFLRVLNRNQTHITLNENDKALLIQKLSGNYSDWGFYVLAYPEVFQDMILEDPNLRIAAIKAGGALIFLQDYSHNIELTTEEKSILLDEIIKSNPEYWHLTVINFANVFHEQIVSDQKLLQNIFAVEPSYTIDSFRILEEDGFTFSNEIKMNLLTLTQRNLPNEWFYTVLYNHDFFQSILINDPDLLLEIFTKVDLQTAEDYLPFFENELSEEMYTRLQLINEKS